MTLKLLLGKAFMYLVQWFNNNDIVPHTPSAV
ncbi:hypothetical protein FRC0484_01833 [Corynebacterium diphtheriae]|nr:hypothetical protein FRC0028_02122 [Corynebacterium diphtheriae]CAB0713569.1 hypothetical protein FRC0081_02116 [Corynebacterium diphtheriae]CAB0762023.1 hypothetical protein FRC0134_02119 [Corynebacterium diphtheriae]CAB0778169.1 hypothetical protein FRC0174_02119 [Corynebacterium diphtheriae]CAB0812668.1 hypothetical protein FRC0261_01920 [Corynebacterium diphtheriae]